MKSRWIWPGLTLGALLLTPALAFASHPGLCDMDGDGKSDATIGRDEGGGIRWWILRSSDAAVSTFPFGTSATDFMLCGDIDGDGTDDPVVWRTASQAQYFAQLSSNGSTMVVSFGVSGDQPFLGDFDNDGKDDFTVYRPSTGTFWVRRSSDLAVTATQWGVSPDFAYVSDRDGDGMADVSVQKSNGTHWTAFASGGASVITWGLGTDIISPLEAGGGAGADLTLIRNQSGQLTWYTLTDTGSTPGFGQPFGISTDTIAPGDFDGDGIADRAVWRSGQWFILRSSMGFQTFFWGASGDYPILNFDVH